MQLHLAMQGHEVSLPIAYRYLLQGMIYHAISADEKLASTLHECGYQAQKRSYKLFTFSPLTGAYTVDGKRITFHNEVRMEIRTADTKVAELLEKALKKGSAVALGQNALLITQSRMEDRHIRLKQASIVTISPIVAYQTSEDGQTSFFAPTDASFCPSIVRNARRKWQSQYGEHAPFEFDISFMPGSAFRKVATNFKGTFITAWNGQFLLKGGEEVIDFLYQTGLGAKSSQGFGMFRIVE